MSQAVERLLCNHEALSSNPSPTEKKKKQKARHWWLTPVILAASEAEIGRVDFLGQPG
jgi:hypothetical protein